MTDEESLTEADTACECKVGRGIETYGLSSMNTELVRRWRGTERERESLRELAAFFNRRVLAATLERAGNPRIDGEVENLYRLLTDDDVSIGMRTQTRRQLESEGVPVDTVEDRFVSHQTIHTHLTDCLDVSRETRPKSPSERRRSDRDRIRALQRRTEVVTADALTRLAESDALSLADFDVLVDVAILCAECGRQSDVGELLDAGGCQCQGEPQPD